MDGERPYGHAEEGDGDCDECEVVPHGHAEDAREEHFIHKRAERGEKSPLYTGSPARGAFGLIISRPCLTEDVDWGDYTD